MHLLLDCSSGAFLPRSLVLQIAISDDPSGSLSALALAPTAASAGGGGMGWHPHHHHHHGLGFGIGLIGGGYGYGGDGCYRTRRVWTPFGFRYRLVNVCAW